MPSRLVITFAAMMSAVPIGAAAAPVRVVSMNLCADELVLRLADRDQVLAVTYLARDSRGSTVATEAVGLPVTRGLTEEVVALKPDLVIAGAFTTRTTVGMLKRVGAPVLELGVPADLDGVRAQIRRSRRRSAIPNGARRWWRRSMRVLPPSCRPSGLYAPW